MVRESGKLVNNGRRADNGERDDGETLPRSRPHAFHFSLSIFHFYTMSPKKNPSAPLITIETGAGNRNRTRIRKKNPYRSRNRIVS